MRLCSSIVVCVMISASPGASAAVFKCVDATGKTSFQQQPCPKTATESRVNTSGGDWLVVQSGKSIPNHPQFTAEVALDMARIKNQGDATIATFRYTQRRKESNYGHTPDPSIMYVLYRCAEGRLTSPSEKLEDLETERLHSYSGYRKKTREDFPFADDFVVGKVCGGAPAASARPVPTSGPAAGIHAAKPEGVTLDDVSVNGDRVVVRGSAESGADVSKFMRNLEAAGYENLALTSMNSSGFELSAKNK